MPSAQLVLTVSRKYSLWPDCSYCEMPSRSGPDVILQISLLLSAVTELTLQALHMKLVDDSFLELDGIREHVISIVNGN